MSPDETNRNGGLSIGIVGGAGYTAGELLRLLLFRNDVDVRFAVSRSHADEPVGRPHPDLDGLTPLRFVGTLPEEPVDYLFLCAGHGESRRFLEEHQVGPDTAIIDLSSDFRAAVDAEYGGRTFVYGLPELCREEIRSARAIANPGCFATAIQLALLPLASEGVLVDDVHVQAITGSTGAGASPSPTTHFSWREGNVSIYRPFTHQHGAEIDRSLDRLQPARTGTVRFIPVRGNFTRGIHATTYTRTDLTGEQLRELYEGYYRDHPFTLVTDTQPDLKQVVNTNLCRLHVERHDDLVLVTSIIDNLLKGASGQAVQNMNLMSGRPEGEGLGLKGVGF